MKTYYSFNVIHEHLRDQEEFRYFAQDACMLAATDAIVAAMDAQNVSRAELAQRIDRTPGFISQVLSGSRNMTLKTLADLAWALGLQVRDITLAPIGEMRVPRSAMDAWLDDHARELHTRSAAVASSERDQAPVVNQSAPLAAVV